MRLRKYPWTILSSKIYHMLGLSGTSLYAVFVYFVFVLLYLRVWLTEISFLISLNKPLFKNIQHVGSFWYFVICCTCVFVYLYFCVWLMEVSFLIFLNKNLFKNILHVGSFWYFVISCICVFVFVYLYMRQFVISVLISLDPWLFKNISMLGISGTFSHAVFLDLRICICVFVYLTVQNIIFDILEPPAVQKYSIR